MYLNSYLSRKSYSKVVDVVNGVPVIQHAHFKERYRERISPLYDETRIEGLKYTRILSDVKYLIRKNADKIVTKDGKFTEFIVNYSLVHVMNGKRIIVEISALVTSSLAKFALNEPEEVNYCYKQAVEDGVIKPYEPVICIETIVTGMRTQGEPRKCYTDFTNDQILRHYRLKTTRNLTDDKFKHMTKNIRKINSMCSYKARGLIEDI